MYFLLTSYFQLENLDITSIMSTNKQPIVCIQTFKTEREGSTALERTLNEVDPQYIIMYHSNVTAIRQLEIFEARKKRPLHKRLRVFFLMYAGTVEEQSYLTSLRREKQAFELLIEAKKVMIGIPGLYLSYCYSFCVLSLWSYRNIRTVERMKLLYY